MLSNYYFDVYCLIISQSSDSFNSWVLFYSNSSQHYHISDKTMAYNFETNIYQVEQNNPDMHMESDKWHKHLFWDLYLTCNDKMK